MMGQFVYPAKNADVEAVLSQDTLNRLTSLLYSWEQGAGSIGGLMLHACWGETSVLARRYQGQTTFFIRPLLQGSMKLYAMTGDPRWRKRANDAVSNILFLQDPEGGFRHAAAEFEPMYETNGNRGTCPIHQCLPVLALLDYMEWAHADETLKQLVRPAIDLHWDWFQRHFWRVGNGYKKKPLDFPGWCGVTNQDLIVIACLAKYAQLFGDRSRFDEFGLPSLRHYLSPAYYHERIGLMERGDSYNFTERTVYNDIIITMLHKINEWMRDEQICDIADNITRHLFDALFYGEDGLLHLSWGAVTDPEDKSHVKEWIRTPITLGAAYPGLLTCMKDYLRRHPDEKRAEQVLQLERTIASYVYADGTLPSAIAADDPLLSIATTPAYGVNFWLYLIERLGSRVRSPEAVPLPGIRRTAGDVVWKTSGKLWEIERSGKRAFAGYKRLPSGVLIGPDERLPGIDFDELERCDIAEIVSYIN